VTLHAPRGGVQPPDTVALDGGETLFVTQIAHEVTRRYGEEYPDSEAQYGPAWRDWCVHDTRFLIGWAALGDDVLARNVRWLADVLAARKFPLDRLARTLDLAADAVAEQGADEIAARLRAATRTTGLSSGRRR
jgi:hypothetical protein